jgi:hypothetical protein
MPKSEVSILLLLLLSSSSSSLFYNSMNLIICDKETGKNNISENVNCGEKHFMLIIRSCCNRAS